MKSVGMFLMVIAIILALVACVYVPWKIVSPKQTVYVGHFCLWNPPSTKYSVKVPEGFELRDYPEGYPKIDVTIVVLELLATAIIGASGYLLYRRGSKKA